MGEELSDKKKICIEISRELYKNFQKEIVEKYGSTYGKIKIALQEGMRLWIANEQKKITNDGGILLNVN